MDPNGADPLAKTNFGDRYTTPFIHCYLPSHYSCTNMTSSLHNQAFFIFPPLLVLSHILLSVVSNCSIKHSAHRRCSHELQTPLVRNLLLSSQLQCSWSHESSRTLWRGFLNIGNPIQTGQYKVVKVQSIFKLWRLFCEPITKSIHFPNSLFLLLVHLLGLFLACECKQRCRIKGVPVKPAVKIIVQPCL